MGGRSKGSKFGPAINCRTGTPCFHGDRRPSETAFIQEGLMGLFSFFSDSFSTDSDTLSINPGRRSPNTAWRRPA